MRYISTSLKNTLGPADGVFSVEAGENINANDILIYSVNSKVYPAQTTDYSVTGDLGASLIAPTSTSGLYNNEERPNFLIHPNTGDIYFLAGNGASSGLAVYQYTTNGVFRRKISILIAGTTVYHPSIGLLTSDDIVVTWSTDSNLFRAIYDQDGLEVLTPTIIEVMSSFQDNKMITLSGGGFMIIWQMSTTTQYERLAVYDNNGNEITAPFNFHTWTGTAGAVFCNLQELSNGNIVIVFRSDFSTSRGLYYAIVNQTGSIIFPVTVTTDTSYYGANRAPGICIGNGYFGINAPNSLTSKLEVRLFKNSGVIQHNKFTETAALGVGLQTNNKLVWDGTNFWLVSSQASNAVLHIIKCPINPDEKGFVNEIGTLTAGGGCMDAFFERGNIIIVYDSSNSGTLKLCVFDPISLIQYVVAGTVEVTSITDGSIRIKPGGDFSFICYAEQLSGFSMSANKYFDTSILGVSISTVLTGDKTDVQIAPGIYSGNKLRGSLKNTFDHTATNLIGNSGVILRDGGLFLKGLV